MYLIKTITKTYQFILLLLCMMTLSSCGLIANAGNKVRGYSPPPEKLLTAEFYKTATPAEVKAEINGRDLSKLAYAEKYYKEDSGGFLFTRKQMEIIGIFLPTSSVGTSFPVYPLELALPNSPYPEVIAMLLDAGVDLTWPYEATPWSNANPDSMKVVLARNYTPMFRCEALYNYATLGNMDLLQYTLSLSPDMVNCKANVNAYSALIGATKNNHVEIVNYLIKNGADIEYKDIFGRSALSYALSGNKISMANLLIKQGANKSLLYSLWPVETKKNYTLLNFALDGKIQDTDLLMLLTEHVPVEGEGGENSLKAACLLDRSEIVNRLLARGAVFPQDTNCLTIKQK